MSALEGKFSKWFSSSCTQPIIINDIMLLNTGKISCVELLHFLNNRCTTNSDSAAQLSTKYGDFKGKHLQTLVLVEDRFVRMKCRIQEVK